MNLYFECANGISGDMAVGALLDLGANKEKLNNALKSIGLDDEFSYQITKTKVNSISATDFNVILKNNEHQHHHEHHYHRNLEDIIKIINKADITEKAKNLAIKIFTIVAEAESKVHNLPLKEVHFHEIGAIDSIVDIISFAVLFDDINPDKVFFKTLTEGSGTVICQHGTMDVPVPAVLEIASKYKLPLKITNNEGEMITPTGIGIVAALYNKEKFPDILTINKVGYGAGKRPYKNPVLRILAIDND